MPWVRGRYYVRSVRVNGRVTSQYVGAGLRGELAARLDQIDRDQREAQRLDARERQHSLLDLARAPAALVEYAAAVRLMVAEVLTALGFHQHKRQWRMRRMADTFDRALAIYRKPQPSADELAELRNLVTKHTSIGRIGDVGVMAEQGLQLGLSAKPGVRAAVEARCDQIRTQLGWGASSELERLLIREIVLTWLDHNRVQIAYAQQTETGFKLDSMEQWERILSSKQSRYLRAVSALARVRRLLNLPAIQVNVALDGGQQVNVQG